MARFYLAFGCNLNLKVISGRCPGAQAVCPVMITDHRLEFAGTFPNRWGTGGVATLVPQRGSTTAGALYLLSEEDEAAMDGFEGLAEGFYIKDEEFATHIRGRELSAQDSVFTYLLMGVAEYNPPPVRYIAAITRGYRDWGLPGHPLFK